MTQASGREPGLADAKQQALQLLARREHTCWELLTKLKHKGYESELAEQAVTELSQDNWVNDNRFCETFIRHRWENGYGPLRIQQELKQRGVAEHLIKNKLAWGELTWISSLQKAYRKRFGDQSVTSAKSRKQCYQYLLQRGFTSSQINS